MILILRSALLLRLLGLGSSSTLRRDAAPVSLEKPSPTASAGKQAALTEEGYQYIVSLTDDEEMKCFAKRILEKHDRTPPAEGSLSGFVKFYSGTEAVQDFARLEAGLLDMTKDQKTPGPGSEALLNEDGYQRVAALKDDEEMKDFSRRVLETHHRTAVESTLGGFVRYFSGTVSVQDFARLEVGLLEMTKDQKLPGPGSDASLDEAGYQSVAALKDDEEMKDYTVRVAQSLGRSLNPSQLGGFVRFFSGTEAVQDFARLKAGVSEMTKDQREPGIGSSASFDEEGYQAVAKLKDPEEMKDYVRRLLAAHGRTAPEGSKFTGFVGFFDGETAIQDYARLETGALEMTADQKTAGPGSVALLTEEGYEQVAKLKDNEEMKDFAKRVLAAHKRVPPETGFDGFIRFFSGDQAMQDFGRLEAGLMTLTKDQKVKGPGSEAALTEEGYQLVAHMKDNEEMKDFVIRVLKDKGRVPPDDSALDGFVRFYSGVSAVQDFARLQAGVLELTKDQKVAGPGMKVPLDEEGYQKVAVLKDNEEMKDFITRVVQADGRDVVDGTALTGIVGHYSGVLATQDFKRLTKELQWAPWATLYR